MENGETVSMVMKEIAGDDIPPAVNHPMLKGLKRYKCVIPACRSSPCQNGGTCTETITGYACTCSTDFFGADCACNVFHTPDEGTQRLYTFPGWHIPAGMTSLDFEVSSNFSARLALSTVDSQQAEMYEIVLGGWYNTGTAIWRSYIHSTVPNEKTPSSAEGALSGRHHFDRFWLNFTNGRFAIGRYGNDAPFFEWTDPNPRPINYIGIMNWQGSDADWKFHSFC
ncbi:C3 and PZP-like alpha-2-macroglobulin domain-containing protein 8 [Diadema setosum]|uniref:C3 and PZP-like alpha-2-macroglobulin domain-containing protein 8 n=1 Tax=Diadema setosum TaxID=31175 RepID=UPI003B3AAE6F